MIGGFQAEHREDLAFDRVGDLGDGDLIGLPRQAASDAGAPEALDEPGLGQGSELLFEETDGDLLPLRDRAGG